MLHYFGDYQGTVEFLKVLHRSGIRLYWSLPARTYVAESIFVERWVATGKSPKEALVQLSDKMQEPDNWLTVVYEMIGQLSMELTFCKREELTPMILWEDVLLHMFREACKDKNTELIHRFYAFAEWGMWIKPRPSDLSTCSVVSFYENIPNFPPALNDLPNWVSFREIDGTWLLNSPFVQRYKRALLAAYGVDLGDKNETVFEKKA